MAVSEVSQPSIHHQKSAYNVHADLELTTKVMELTFN